MINVKEKNRNNIILALQVLAVFCIAVIHYSTLFSIKIGTASPLIIIPFLIIVSYYSGMWRGVIFAFAYGIYMDSVAADTLCFNTLALGLIFCVCGVLITYFFNRNISAALLLSLGAALAYFVLKWLFFFVFTATEGHHIYLFRYAVPSAIYSAVFALPFYHIAKFFSNKQK